MYFSSSLLVPNCSSAFPTALNSLYSLNCSLWTLSYIITSTNLIFLAITDTSSKLVGGIKAWPVKVVQEFVSSTNTRYLCYPLPLVVPTDIILAATNLCII